MELRGSSDSGETISSVGSAASRTDLLATARRRFSSSATSPNAFSTPTFTSAAGAGGSNSSLNIDPSLLQFTQSRMSRLHFSSSSSSSNESPDSPSAAEAARKRLQRLIKLRSLSYLSHRGSSQSPLSPIENLHSLPLSVRSSPSFSAYKNPMNMEVEEDVLVMDALGESMPLTCRARKPLETLSSSSSSSSVNSSHFGANFVRTEICRSWEERGLCRFGSCCQFAHGKEELRGAPGPSKLKPEVSKQLSTAGSGGFWNKYPQYFPTLLMDSAPPSSEESSSSSVAPEAITRKTDTEKVKSVGAAAKQLPVQPNPTFSWPPTEDEESEIQWVLFGPGQRQSRLWVFQDICLESEK